MREFPIPTKKSFSNQQNFERELAFYYLDYQTVDEWQKKTNKINDQLQRDLANIQLRLEMASLGDELITKAQILKKEKGYYTYYFYRGKEIGFYNGVGVRYGMRGC